jgi:putative hydrolases of HD superfamily
MLEIEQLLNFMRLTHKFQQVQRIVRATGESDRWENDAEHSYQLAVMGWYIVSCNNLNLDVNLVISYALVHDLVEVYAGDTYFYTTDQKLKDSKVDREKAAADRLREEFPEFNDLHHLIEGYEKKADDESKFIYALDKVVPMMNIYLDQGRTWKEKDIVLDMLIENKTEKVAVSPQIKDYFEKFILILKEHENELFSSK